MNLKKEVKLAAIFNGFFDGSIAGLWDYHGTIMGLLWDMIGNDMGIDSGKTWTIMGHKWQ